MVYKATYNWGGSILHWIPMKKKRGLVHGNRFKRI